MKVFGKMMAGVFTVVGVYFSTAKLFAFAKSKIVTDKKSDDFFIQHVRCPQSMFKGWSKNDPSYVEGTDEYNVANKPVVEYTEYLANKVKDKVTDIVTGRKELKKMKEKLAELEKSID